ncbi:MAG: OmpA family protein [Kofleriaceae bacterium]|nr:OmpA family protein [Kofleriaceae bacterium]
MRSVCSCGHDDCSSAGTVTSHKQKVVIMRHPFLASALTLLIGSGAAYAQTADTYNQQQQTPSTQQQQTTSTHKTKTKTKTTPMGQTASVENVDTFFKTNSAKLSESATTDLTALADWAKCDTRNAIILEGSADPRGTQLHNMRLSGERAAAVRQKLIDLGVPSQRIVVQVFGKNRREGSFAHQRRVTARAAQTPVSPQDLQG